MQGRLFHVALYIGTLSLGGAAKDTVTFAREFSEMGHSVDLLLSEKKGVFLTAVPEQVRVVELGGSRAIRDLFPLISYMRREKPEVLISTLGQHNMVALLARRLARTDTSVIIREAVMVSILTHQVRSGKSIRRWITRKTYPWADNIIAVSQGAADDLSRYFGLSRNLIQVVFGPVVTQDLLEKICEPVHHPWFGSTAAPVVLAAGQLEVHKGFDTLLSAFRIVRNYRSARLVILGEGSHRANLEQVVMELGLTDDVSMPGFTLNPFKYMALASLFVLSSPSEGLGNVIIEAMACGTSVVSTDCPGGPREILDGGRYGRLVPVGDVVALAEAINSTLDNPTPKDLLLEGASRFSSNEIAKRYVSIFTDDRRGRGNGLEFPVMP
jgi:glycosyltransferase involved in cell wall biosynthesis